MNKISVYAMALAFLSGAVYGQVPSGNGTSDPDSNTGVGSFALHGPAATAAGTSNTGVGTGALQQNGANANTAVGALAMGNNVSGSNNAALGYDALRANQTGSNNTATGSTALYWNDFASTGASGNTADGASALTNNLSGSNNTAVGFQALLGVGTQQSGGLSSGSNNTAVGANALSSYSTANYNTASGAQALHGNVAANNNTAVGYQALYTNDSDGAGDAIDNTATGYQALFTNSTGAANTATGDLALYANSTGGYNTAGGFQALYLNATGSYNTAFGPSALFNSNGSNNIALGYEAGFNLKTGSNNIEIGNKGAAGDNKLIKIGTEGTQAKTFIAGIYSNTTVSGLAVVIGSNGELGAVSSSERFKTDVEPMAENTARLRQLRPVTFHYKADSQGALRYGLIAEEVAKVYPELVVRDDQGRIDGVRYDELAPMLLNEVQKQASEIRHLKRQQRQFAKQSEVNELKQQLHAALAALQAKDRLVARR